MQKNCSIPIEAHGFKRVFKDMRSKGTSNIRELVDIFETTKNSLLVCLWHPSSVAFFLMCAACHDRCCWRVRHCWKRIVQIRVRPSAFQLGKACLVFINYELITVSLNLNEKCLGSCLGTHTQIHKTSRVKVIERDICWWFMLFGTSCSKRSYSKSLSGVSSAITLFVWVAACKELFAH